MIGFSSVLGVYVPKMTNMFIKADTHRGLFLSGGKAIFLARPGVTIVAYLVVGSVLW